MEVTFFYRFYSIPLRMILNYFFDLYKEMRIFLHFSFALFNLSPLLSNYLTKSSFTMLTVISYLLQFLRLFKTLKPNFKGNYQFIS